jgi:hypothetical protein
VALAVLVAVLVWVTLLLFQVERLQGEAQVTLAVMLATKRQATMALAVAEVLVLRVVTLRVSTASMAVRGSLTV